MLQEFYDNDKEELSSLPRCLSERKSFHYSVSSSFDRMYSLLPSYTQTTWITCLTAIVSKLIGINICG